MAENDDINLEVYILIEEIEKTKLVLWYGMVRYGVVGGVKVFSENKFSLSKADYRNALLFGMILLFPIFSGGWMKSESGKIERQGSIDEKREREAQIEIIVLGKLKMQPSVKKT